MRKIIIRDLDGHYITSLPDNISSVKNWFRQNSPQPSYPAFAKRFTLESAPINGNTPAYLAPDNNPGKLSFEQYAAPYGAQEPARASA